MQAPAFRLIVGGVSREGRDDPLMMMRMSMGMASIPTAAVIDVAIVTVAAIIPAAMPAVTTDLPRAAVVIAATVEVVGVRVAGRQSVVVTDGYGGTRPGRRWAYHTRGHHQGRACGEAKQEKVFGGIHVHG